ncbi:YggT family protein, partial [Stutzerimonas stutzeri]|uniref:YggT family protein n=1 Tax=Stutzerimonas stutzeri TaxID=316 RepID=UPI0024B7938E
MSQLSQALILVIQTLGSLYLLIVLLRFILQLVRADFYNPLSQFIVKATHPLLRPMRRVIPSMGSLDLSSLVLAIIVQMVLMALILLITSRTTGNPPLPLVWALVGITVLVLNI